MLVKNIFEKIESHGASKLKIYVVGEWCKEISQRILDQESANGLAQSPPSNRALLIIVISNEMDP